MGGQQVEFNAEGYTMLKGKKVEESTSPAQLVHDFEGLPHVPRIECDGTLPLHAVFLVQGVWTVPGAPEMERVVETCFNLMLFNASFF